MIVEELSAAIAEIIEKLDGFVFRVAGPGVVRSAVAVDEYVVTAAHRLEADAKLEAIGSDGEKFNLEPAGVDRRLDLAVYRAREDIPKAPVHGGERLKVGNLVFALGRPGLSLRAAFGIISVFTTEFRGPTGVKLTPYLEVDGNLPYGFSGGPLISHKGELIGMNTSVPRGSGMTVPVANIRASIANIESGGTVKTGYLGVNTAQAKLAGGETGLVITGVDPESPAAASNLAAGDIILTIDDEPMTSQAALYHVLLDGPREVTLVIGQGGSKKDLRVGLEERKRDR